MAKAVAAKHETEELRDKLRHHACWWHAARGIPDRAARAADAQPR